MVLTIPIESLLAVVGVAGVGCGAVVRLLFLGRRLFDAEDKSRVT